jgi:spore coat polysaccharide biosynthesis protein SpsF
LNIRKAEHKDIQNVYMLFVDKTVRLASKDPSSITLEEHEVWFNSRILQDEFFILEKNGEFVGEVRVDKKNNENVVSIELVKKHRNKGYGFEALRKCLQLINKSNVVAYIKSNNIASIKLFQKVGFVELLTGGGGGMKKYIIYMYNYLVVFIGISQS